MDLYEYATMFIAGALGFTIKYLQGKMKNIKVIILNIVIVVSIVFVIVPAISEHFNLSLTINSVVVWVLSVFNDKLMRFVEKKIDNKIKYESK
jgi:hypothetical protein